MAFYIGFNMMFLRSLGLNADAVILVFLISGTSGVGRVEPELLFLGSTAGNCLLDRQGMFIINAEVDYTGVDFVKTWTKSIDLENEEDSTVCQIIDATVCPSRRIAACYCSKRANGVSSIVMNLTVSKRNSGRTMTLYAFDMDFRRVASINTLTYPRVSDKTQEFLLFNDTAISPVESRSIPSNVTYINYTVTGLQLPYTLSHDINSSPWTVLHNTPNVVLHLGTAGYLQVCIRYEEFCCCKRNKTICFNRETTCYCDMTEWHSVLLLLCMLAQVFLTAFGFLSVKVPALKEKQPSPIITVYLIVVAVQLYFIPVYCYQELIGSCLDTCHYGFTLVELIVTYSVILLIGWMLHKDPSMRSTWTVSVLAISVMASTALIGTVIVVADKGSHCNPWHVVFVVVAFIMCVTVVIVVVHQSSDDG